MGNSGSNSTSQRRRRNSSSRRNSLKGIDSNVEKFFTSKGLNNNDVSVEQILRQFSQSFIIKTILVDNSKESHDNNENKLKVDLNQVKQIFSDLFGGYSNTALVESYVSILFEPTNDNEFELVESVFQDCLVFSLKAVGFKRPKLSDYSKKTLNNMVRSIQFTNEGGKLKTSQSNIKDWVMNNFPLLFNGFNHWLSSVLKEQKPAKIENVEANDLSHFMNLTMIWYLVNNLPNCYTKDLASENGTLFEKLKNCLTENRWHPLYQSENHGLSLNRFQANLFNYKAGTMVFIFCKTGSLYCICSNEEYKESPTAYGDEQTRIVRIWDEFKDYEIGSSGNIYLNTKSRFLKLGLIFGYSNQLKPVLKISKDLHWADHELSSNDEIIAVEGWACGSSKAAADQASMKKWENKQLEKMRTVNRGVAGGWGEEKAILDLAGVKTEHSERGDI